MWFFIFFIPRRIDVKTAHITDTIVTKKKAWMQRADLLVVPGLVEDRKPPPPSMRESGSNENNRSKKTTSFTLRSENIYKYY